MKTVSRWTPGHFLALTCLVIAGVGTSQAQTIGAADGRAMVARGALLVDVRSAQEFSEGHVEGAINIPHVDVEKRLSEFGENRDRDIVLYCRSGHRAGLAQQSLRALGYSHVYNAGGYQDWLAIDDPK